MKVIDKIIKTLESRAYNRRDYYIRIQALILELAFVPLLVFRALRGYQFYDQS